MYTLVNCHSNRKSTRIEDVFQISYWTRWNFIAMLSYQRVIALCFPAPEVLGLSTRWWPWFLSLIRLLPWHGPGSVSGKINLSVVIYDFSVVKSCQIIGVIFLYQIAVIMMWDVLSTVWCYGIIPDLFYLFYAVAAISPWTSLSPSLEPQFPCFKPFICCSWMLFWLGRNI